MIQYDVSRVIDQLLRQHEAGIKMYLVCRLGGAERLSKAYAEFREMLARGSSTELQTAPSLPAFAYAAARRAASAHRAAEEPAGFETIPWEPTPQGRPARYGEVLDRIRSQLGHRAAEAIELHRARGLDADDVAYVVGTRLDAVNEALFEGAALVERLGATLEPAQTVDTLVQDAFRPRTVADPADASRLHARPARLAEGALLGGRFEVSSAPQTGALASIYLANDTSVPGESVVLHLLHGTAATTSARNGLLRKLRMLDSVIHASIGRVLDCGWHADRLWYATPWYEGHTLRQLVQQQPLSSGEAIDIFAPIARALSSLHEHGVIHRNISDRDILILRVGTKGAYETLPVLTGFDTWLLGEVGTSDEPRSLAPEVATRLLQVQQAGAPTPSEDVFALGLALLGSVDPRTRASTDESWQSFLARRAKSPVEVSGSARLARLEKLLGRALAHNPEERPSAAELAAALDRARPEVAEKRARRRLLWPLLALAAVVALLLIAFFVRQSRLRLIEATIDAVDAQVLGEELEQEKARSRELERRLNEASRPEP